MTREELLEDLDAPEPEAEEFELAPGKVLRIKAPSDYAAVEKLVRQGAAVKANAKAEPLKIRGRAIAVTDKAISMAAVVAASVVEPRITMRDALLMRGRYGLRYANLWGRCLELAGASLEAEEEAVEDALDADPTTRDD